jgi:hypothetical protein
MLLALMLVSGDYIVAGFKPDLWGRFEGRLSTPAEYSPASL